MAINIFSDYGGFYNSYKVTDIPKVDVEAVKRQDELKAQEALALPELPKTEMVPETVKPDLRSKTADLDNISLTFNAGDDFSYLGSDFEIEKLDINRAISDMHKDKILEDYQYFVGTQNDSDATYSGEEGKVFLKF